MKNKKNLYYLILALVTFFGFVIRVFQVEKIPPGLFTDEASIGYNAYTIIESGTDEVGNFLPVFFKNFYDLYRPGVSIYFSAPFVFLFGLNEFSLRFASSIIGALTIIAIFFLGKTLFSTKIGLFSALMLAISPWHFHFSRIGQEIIYLAFFVTVSTNFFILGIKKKKASFFYLSFFFFGLTLYAYVPAYFLVPLFVIYLSLIFLPELKKKPKQIILGFIVLTIMALPLFFGLTNQKTLSRAHQLKGTSVQHSQTEIISAMFKTYKDHFLPEFLFKKGDIGYHSHFITRFSVKGIGQLYWFQLPLIIIGLIAAWSYKKSFAFLLGWLLFYPLGSTLFPFADGGGPFAFRSIIGVIPFQILSALGISRLISLFKNKLNKKIFILLSFLIITFSFGDFLNKYFNEYPLYSADFWGWQYGPKEIIKYFETVHENYDDLFMSGSFNSPYIFLKFYSPHNCSNCQIGDLGKLNPRRKQLFALRPEEIKISKENIKTHKIIDYPNGKPAFLIFEVSK